MHECEQVPLHSKKFEALTGATKGEGESDCNRSPLHVNRHEGRINGTSKAAESYPLGIPTLRYPNESEGFFRCASANLRRHP